MTQVLAGVAQDCARQFGGKPTRESTLHLTLAFLGEMPDASVSQLVREAQHIRAEPFTLRIDRLGYWGHNRLLWAGCESSPDPLVTLVGDLRARLHRLGVRVDAGEFTPHVTLLRRCPSQMDLQGCRQITPILWSCREFVLVRSNPAAAATDYQRVALFPFSGQ